MKKILLFLLSGIMVICCAVAFISCKTTEETYLPVNTKASPPGATGGGAFCTIHL